MSQSIGKTIRNLRKERNLTQEELAELLNISSQAISKWENEAGLPDISQIVPLASVFGVTTDRLFGLSGSNEQADVDKLIEELHTKSKNLEIDDYEEYKQKIEVLKQYPHNFSLLYSCFLNGSLLLRTEWQETLSKEEQKTIYNECIRQSNVIFSYCTQTHIIINTKKELIELLIAKGEQEKALKLINELPKSITNISDIALSHFLIQNNEWDNTIKTCQKNIYELLGELSNQGHLLVRSYMKNGDYVKAESVCLSLLDLIKTIFRNQTYTPPFHLEQSLYRFLAICEIKKNNETRAVSYLESMYEYTLCQAKEFQKTAYVKTPLLDTYKMDYNYPNYEPKEILLDNFSKECFKPLANNPTFQMLKEKIQKLPQ